MLELFLGLPGRRGRALHLGREAVRGCPANEDGQLGAGRVHPFRGREEARSRPHLLCRGVP